MLFGFVETWRTASLQLKNLFKILHAMFTQWTFEIGWKDVTFIDIAAHLAHPATFAVFGFLLRLWLGFYVVLVIIVGHRRLVGKHLCVKHISDKHGMCAEVDALGDTTSQISIGVFRNEEHMVNCAMLSLAISEFVHLAPRLEAEVKGAPIREEDWNKLYELGKSVATFVAD